MRKPSFESFRACITARSRRNQAAEARSTPRLEPLEARVVMSTFQVNTTLDTVAVNLSTGKDATGHISLRSAIMAADAQGGSNTIILPQRHLHADDRRRQRGRERHRRPRHHPQSHHQGRRFAPAPSSTATTWIGSSRSCRAGRASPASPSSTGRPASGGGLLNSGGQVTLSSVVVTGTAPSARTEQPAQPAAASHGGNGGNGGNGGDGTAGLGAGSSTRPGR